MEIGPIAAVRIAPVISFKETDLGLTDVDQIERSSRTGDETYSPSGGQAATGFEDDEEKPADAEDETQRETSIQPSKRCGINYIA